MWEWTLNWNEIRHDIVIGSCPMTTKDIDRMRTELALSAVLSLQHAECLKHFDIDYERHVEHGRRAGLAMARCPMRDFDPPDQRRHLPEAVRRLHELLAAGHRVYLHCTAGFNRAPLTVLAYLTFVESQSPEAATALIRQERPGANPNWEAYLGCREDLIEQHQNDIRLRAWSLYQQKAHGTAPSDWYQAESEVIREALAR